ncbi:DUF5370 family protein [Sutcliffiella cohnii]
MGATEREGYVFETEYSVIQQKGAVHVYKKGHFISELPFQFEGNQPSSEQIENVIDQYLRIK